MTRLTKYTREQMARALTKHRFQPRAEELMAESVELFEAVYAERYDPQTRKLMRQLEKRHPRAFGKSDSIYLNANGFRTYVGAETIGGWNSVRWTAEIDVRPFLHDDEDTPSPPLASRIADHALATQKFAENVAEAYRKALAALSQFHTAKRLAEEWPEAMPVIQHLIGVEDRSVPVVQLATINDEFGLPPVEAEAALSKALGKAA
jgi:hypothetical protein